MVNESLMELLTHAGIDRKARKEQSCGIKDNINTDLKINMVVGRRLHSLVQYRNQRQTVVNAAKNLQVPREAENFLTS